MKMLTCLYYCNYFQIGESLRLPTPSRILVTIIYIKKLYIHELLVI